MDLSCSNLSPICCQTADRWLTFFLVTQMKCLRPVLLLHTNCLLIRYFSEWLLKHPRVFDRILQRTSISTNIKERLDFSCAVFGPDGGLVSNAPHIPVHLGAMQETVRYQIKAFNDNFERGDVILSNHPSAGGSHLPDLTVITPIFHEYVHS